MIERLQAQRACIDWAAAHLAAAQPPVVLELGLGSGRTYDHLRQSLPGARILVFDLAVNAHPACVPPDEDLVLGDVTRTLPALRPELAGRVGLVHADIGTADHELNQRIAASLAPLMATLLQADGLLLSNRQELGAIGLRALPMPDGAAVGHCFLFRRPPA